MIFEIKHKATLHQFCEAYEREIHGRFNLRFQSDSVRGKQLDYFCIRTLKIDNKHVGQLSLIFPRFISQFFFFWKGSILSAMFGHLVMVTISMWS